MFFSETDVLSLRAVLKVTSLSPLEDFLSSQRERRSSPSRRRKREQSRGGKKRSARRKSTPVGVDPDVRFLFFFVRPTSSQILLKKKLHPLKTSPKQPLRHVRRPRLPRRRAPGHLQGASEWERGSSEALARGEESFRIELQKFSIRKKREKEKNLTPKGVRLELSISLDHHHPRNLTFRPSPGPLLRDNGHGPLTHHRLRGGRDPRTAIGGLARG